MWIFFFAVEILRKSYYVIPLSQIIRTMLTGTNLGKLFDFRFCCVVVSNVFFIIYKFFINYCS